MIENTFLSSWQKMGNGNSSGSWEGVIKTVDSWVLELPVPAQHRDFDDASMEIVGVTVETDQGHIGVGYTWTEYWGGGLAVKALIDQVYRPRLLGMPLMWSADMWFDFWWITRRLGSGVTMMALSAVDIAIWDVRSRTNGMSLAKYLGQVRDRVPTYSSGRYSPELPVADLVFEAESALGSGFDAIKIRIGKDVKADVERIGAMREAIGDSVRLMIDANEQLDLASAQWLAHRVSEFDITWFEEPMPSEYVQSYSRLAANSQIPIAFGEHMFDLAAFAEAADRDCAQILQPDVCKVGGVTGFMRIADLALARGIPLAAHYIPEIHIHLAAALPHNLYVESVPGIGDLMTESLVVEEGSVLVPDGPGLGIVFEDWTWQSYQVA